MRSVESKRQFKSWIKSALIEVLEERRDLITDAVGEAMEDLGMLRAIQEGEKSPLVDRAKVMRALRAK